MTRKLNPPVPIYVTLLGGRPVAILHAGRRSQVTHVANTWVRPGRWWGVGGDVEPQTRDRTYYRLVLNGRQVVEVFTVAPGTTRGWYLERIVD
jgi:hypothetical protein